MFKYTTVYPLNIYLNSSTEFQENYVKNNKNVPKNFPTFQSSLRNKK